MEDYVTAGSKADRQRRLADLLRKMAVQTSAADTTDPGRMVSGHYVAPSWAQGLAQNVVKPMEANYAAQQSGQMADQMEGAYNQSVNQAQQAWMQNMPQGQPGVDERAGPVDPNNPQELAAVAPQPVTSGQVLKQTLAGLQIPGNEKAAALYNQTAMGDLAREDNQAFRAQEAAANRAARLQDNLEKAAARMEELKLKMEDRALDRASREQAARDANALRAQIAEGNQALQKLALQARREATAATKSAAADKKADLTAKDRETLDAANATETALDRGIAALKSSKGDDYVGYGPGLIQNFVPGGSSVVQRGRSKEINDAIQQITYTTDEIRHGRFGSALTATEKASAMQYLPGEYDTKEQIIQKAEGIQKLVKLNNQKLRAKEKGTSAPTPAAAPGGVVDWGSMK